MKMLNILDHKLLLSRWSKSKSVLTMVKKRPEAPTACLYAGNWFRHVGGLAHLDPEPEKTQFWAKVFTFDQSLWFKGVWNNQKWSNFETKTLAHVQTRETKTVQLPPIFAHRNRRNYRDSNLFSQFDNRWDHEKKRRINPKLTLRYNYESPEILVSWPLESKDSNFEHMRP